MDRLTKFVRRRLAARQQESTDHLDTDRMSAFAEGRLTSGERQQALSHLAACVECRDVLALIANAAEEQVPVTQHKSEWWKWRIAATFALACVALSVVFYPSLMVRTPEPVPVPLANTQALPAKDAPVLAEPKVAAPRRSTSLTSALPVISPAPNAIRRRLTQPKALPFAAAPVPAPAEQAPAPPASTSSADSVLQRQLLASPKNSFYPAAAKARAPTLAKAAPVFQRRVLWSLSSEGENGTLQRSVDGGQTWLAVTIDSASRLEALSVNGSDIWAGGADGVLFHSFDDGTHWNPVTVADNGVKLAGSITGISVQNSLFIRLAVHGQNNWISINGGQHWQQER